mgnify:CR=1 FL=1
MRARSQACPAAPFTCLPTLAALAHQLPAPPAAADRTIKIWDTASGTLRLTLTGHIEQVHPRALPALLPGALPWCTPGIARCRSTVQPGLPYAQATHLRVYPSSPAPPPASLRPPPLQVTGLAVSPRHPCMFSCALDKMVKCWDLEQNKASLVSRCNPLG